MSGITDFTPPPLTKTILLIAAIVALTVCSLFLYRQVHPAAGITLEQDLMHVEDHVSRLLSALGFDAEEYSVSMQFAAHNAVQHRVFSRQRAGDALATLRAQGGGYSWIAKVTEKEPASQSVHIGGSQQEEEIRRALAGDIRLEFDMHNTLRRLTIPVEDSVSLPNLSGTEAYQLVRRLLVAEASPLLLGPLAHVSTLPEGLRKVTDVDGIRYAPGLQEFRQDHTFSWVVYDALLADSIDVTATCKGDVISNFSFRYRTIDALDWKGSMGVVDLMEISVYGVLVITLLVVGFRRVRSFEIGFVNALAAGIASAVLMAIWLYLQVFSAMGMTMEAIISLIIAPATIGGGITLLWAVGESVGRETWREKFISFDLLTRGHLLHSRIGFSVLTGIAVGCALMLAALASGWLLSFSRTLWSPQVGSEALSGMSSSIPALFITGEAVFSNIAGFALFILFVLSLLRQHVQRTAVLVAAASLLLVVIDLPNLLPIPEAWLVQLPVVVLLVLFFIRSDVLGTLFAMVTLSILQQGLLFFLPWNPAVLDQGFLLLAILATLIIYAIVTIATPDRQLDFESIAPRFQRHISERQRLARELEIARDVQMSFLPKTTPQIEGLDIAAHCAPALEVGGDYYDFIDIGPGKFGLAIGDVSGKGTQAAFYMTLTKGFLKALGTISASPSNVLGRLNNLFYENVERGNFISMIYAVFDMNQRTVTIARAGHTPLMRRSADTSVDIIQSRGMALGFEPGTSFTSTIEEVTLPLRSGEVLLFYTDGYPEAMTRSREEFGEQRLSTSLHEFVGDTAQDVLDHVHRETRRFTGNAKQHDDMSMVVVHVH